MTLLISAQLVNKGHISYAFMKVTFLLMFWKLSCTEQRKMNEISLMMLVLTMSPPGGIFM